MAEILQVLAVVKDIEKLLVLARPVQIGAQACSSSYHLPELGFGPDDFEKNQIDHFRHVDASVEHVHRYGDMRHAVLHREFVNQALHVLGLIGHDAGELPFVVRVVDIEAFGDKIGVSIALRKYDGFAQAVATGHLLAIGHQMFEHLVHCVDVEQPFV